MKFLIVKTLLRLGLEKGLKSQKPQFTGLKILAIILFLIAMIFALIAGHQILVFYYGLINANLYYAGGFAVLSLLIVIIIAMKKRQVSSSKYNPDKDSTLQAIKAPLEEKAELASLQIQRSITNNTGKALLGAIILGLFLGARTRK